MTAGLILDTAKKLITGDRAQSYGSIHDNAAEVAKRLTLQFGNSHKPSDYAITMLEIKMARLKGDKRDFDTLVDIAGYADLAWQLIEDEGNA